MLFTDWMGLSGLALVWLLFAMRLPYAQRLDGKRRMLLAGLGYVVVMFPIAGWSLAIWLRGMVGDLSLTSMLLLSAAVFARLFDLPPQWDARERSALLGFLAVLALLLYPFALGLGALDPYRSGYGGVALLLMLALLALWLMRRGFYLLPLVFAVAATGWSFNMLESTNLWDYLIDAPLAIYALWVTIKMNLLYAWRRSRA
ncbi:MAG: hypothetical protein KKF58_05575 [Gammaproteobacteria bacterium]|nr:hypothetical protein [Gammaproteobacteria bacterium]MBU1447763.1 hypothetical protein [Gammaproteobacteria bacterium]MDD2929679.1 hypothetical protein [Sideroxydans sp.]MDD5471349.1 hypothetical protein [Sideroxydans sp.]